MVPDNDLIKEQYFWCVWDRTCEPCECSEHHFVHWRKHIFRDHIEIRKPRRMTNCTHIRQQTKKDVATKCLRTQLAFSHWSHQSASNRLLTLHPSDICRSRLVNSNNSNVILLQQFLHAIRQTSSKFFSAQCAWGNQVFPNNFAECWAISKILSKQTEQ